MQDAIIVAGLWILFGGTHIALSSVTLRPRIVARVGERGYLALFSLLALVIFVPLVSFYFGHKHTGPWLYSVALGPIARWALYVGMGVAFCLMAASFVSPSPLALGGPMVTARGVHRITRHPLFMGLGLFGILHAIPNASATDLAFFGGFPVFAVVGCHHQDRRKLASLGDDFRKFHAETPFLPFAGSGALRGLAELPKLAVAAGIAVTVLLRVFHAPLFAG